MLFRRTRFDRELKEEILSHVAEREAAYLADGVPPEQARRRAMLDFGNPTLLHEQSRDVWLVRWLDNIRRDMRIALRMLVRAPGFALAAILTLALGIGANTAIFTIVDALLLRPLPYAQPDRLVQIAPGFPVGALPILREHGRHFEGIGGYRAGTEVTWTGGADPMRLSATIVSGDLFPLLGIDAAQGRTIQMADERKGSERVVIVSHVFWQQHLSSSSAAVGQSITINDEPLRIVGVMPASFRFPDATTDVWIPATIDTSEPIALWAAPAMQYVGRLASGALPAVAQADVPRIAALVRDGFPWPMPTEFGRSTEIIPLQESTVAGVRDGFLMLAGAVALVLLVACANVATLLLARSESRGRELAVRGALGAGRGRLALQLLLESAIVAVLGTAAGLALLFAALPAMSAALPADVPRIRALALDLRVLLFAGGAALLTTLLTGVLPALRAARPDLTSALRTGDQRSGRRTGAFSTLVAIEVALALVLVAGAGLLLRSLSQLTSVDPGFAIAGLSAARVHPIETRYETPESRVDLYRRLIERAAANPGVEGAAAVSHLPLDAEAGWIALAIEDHPVAEGAPAWTAEQRFITPEYFDVMGISLRQGRAFDARDGVSAPGAIVINDTMARRYWPNQSAIGRRIKPVWQTEWRTVVGVVADVRNKSLAEDAEDELYLPYAQNPIGTMTLVARSTLEPQQTAAALRRVVADVDPQAPVSDAAPIAFSMRETVADRRFLLQVLGAFAAIALGLGAIGIYGVTAYGVARRGREIGLRLALGATRREVIAELARRTAGPVAGGLALGLAGALATGQLLRGMLYQASPTDPAVLGTVFGLLAFTALAATVIPAFRATGGDPAAALRNE
ncbi:MAG: ABC transporter permease [Acidobacteriota bacterium]|nr:ABC transporter permease [Acidobacteriota bacterium]